ncbi:thiol reductant ABC exporter subunit CydC [Endozoicomonas sp. (ex Bugula neritina AB1)]|nr:thiol reductant ABC exporter subunit CydC [Endozoicomonas sp. (ex Bugula neritina AB1)]
MRDLWPFIKLYRQHIGLLSLGILLSIVTLLASLSLLTLSGWFITATALAGLSVATAQSFNFFTPGAGVRGFSIARTAARYGERLVSHDATFRLLSWLRGWFFRKLIPVSMQELSRYRKGDILDRLVADIDALDQLYLRLFSPLLSAVVVTALLSLFLAFFSPTLAVTVLIVMSSWILLMPFLFYRLGRRTGESLGVRQARLRQEVLDYLQGMAEHQIYNNDAATRASISNAEDRLSQTQKTMSGLTGLGSALFLSGSGLAALLILYLAAGEFQLQQLSGPVMVMMVFTTLAAFEALMPLPAAFQFLSHTRAAASRLQEVVSSPTVLFIQHPFTQQHKALVKGDLVFNQVNGGYSSHQMVVKNLSLTIKQGQHIAILGRTGCGKSTLIKLLNRELEPSSGDICFGDQSIATLSEQALYSSLRFVPQKTHVFSGTLRENLTIADPSATDDQLMKIVYLTGLNGLAANNEDGRFLDLWIGQGGVALSGGEQRRLAIARAILKPAPVLILDEPGEGLDVHSEQQLMACVLDAFRQSTVIMITHKKTVLKQMDRVYQMDNGQLY